MSHQMNEVSRIIRAFLQNKDPTQDDFSDFFQ